MLVLVVSSRLSVFRRLALAKLVGTEGSAVFLDTSQIGPRAFAPEVGAVLIDGPGEGWPQQLVTAAGRRGLPVVTLGTTLTGIATLGPAFGECEAIAEVADPGDPHTARLDDQFVVVDGFRTVEVAHAGLRPVLAVSYRSGAHMVVAAGRVDGTRMVCSGLGELDAALGISALATILRRGLRPGLPEAEGPPLGLGVVGYGRYGGMGFLHGSAAEATRGLEFVATCDRDPERRKEAEGAFPGVAVYSGLDEMAADQSVDLVVVATPPISHAITAASLLRHGKHVVCEKPLCLTAADADELIALARENGRILSVNQSRRWDRDFVGIRRVVESGALGELFNMETFVGGFEHPCRAWHSDDTVSGGMVYDWGSHHLDWILQLMGQSPSSVSAIGHKRVWHDVTNLDQIRVRLGWADGREAEFVCSDVAAVRRPKFYLQGTRGTLVGSYRPLRFERIDPTRGYVADHAHHAEAPAEVIMVRHEAGFGLVSCDVPLAPEAPFAFHRNLVDHLALGDPLAVTAESVRDVVAVLEAATRSAAEGGVALEPASVEAF